MATITDYKKHEGDFRLSATSDPAATATSDSVEMDNLGGAFPHNILGVRLYDGSGDEITNGSATGTFTVTVYSINSGHAQSPTTNPIDASGPEDIDFLSNADKVIVTLAGDSGITTWTVTLTANVS